MTNLIARSHTGLDAAGSPDSFTRAESKELARLQNNEVTHGLVVATRVQSAALVAAASLQATAMLSREAAFQADGDPAAMNRLNYIVDQFAAFAGTAVARFGL